MPYTPDPTMTVNAVKNRIVADPTIMALLPGGFYTRPVTRGSTSDAFDSDMRLMNAGYVSDAGEGIFDVSKPHSFSSSVFLYFLANADEERKDLMRQAKRRAKLLLLQKDPDDVSQGYWSFANEYGRLMFPSPRAGIADFGTHDSEPLPGSVVTSFRIEFVGMRA